MTQRTVEIAAQATRDIGEIHHASRRRFGNVAAGRYRALIAVGIETLSGEPAQKAAKGHEDLPDGIWTYHLRHVRQARPEKVGNPRHLLVFTYDDANLRILRVLHEAMDFSRHVSR